MAHICKRGNAVWGLCGTKAERNSRDLVFGLGKGLGMEIINFILVEHMHLDIQKSKIVRIS